MSFSKPSHEVSLPDTISILGSQGKGYGIYTEVDIESADTIFPFYGSIVNRTVVHNFNAALQIDANLFLESRETFDEFVNHSCSQNCLVGFSRWVLVTRRNIKRGEELTFDYNTTEYDLIEQGCSFQCRCGSKKCLGKVMGFKYLSSDQKRKIVTCLSPFLIEQMREELQSLALR